jgi:hypothetical protein
MARTNKKSELGWNLEDYEYHEIEAPQRIIETPDATEGELMSDEEVQEHIEDSFQTIRVLGDRTPEKALKLRSILQDDLDYLMAIGRLEAEDYNELSDLNE